MTNTKVGRKREERTGRSEKAMSDKSSNTRVDKKRQMSRKTEIVMLSNSCYLIDSMI